ncbi:MAG: VWA domain-containing protein [Muribaculaceae bacterium]|nr:VWA domain-containing protein [Muribaculaceae bacterium]
MNIFNFIKMSAQPIEGSADAKAMPQTENTENDNIAEIDHTVPDYESAKVNQGSEDKVRVHNLIILDESGSMMSIYSPALTGVNETLQTIRGAQDDHPDQKHFVTLVTFDTGHYNRIYQNTPAEKAIDITEDQYSPCGGTPLYDAMGRSITELRPNIAKGDIVLVTVITDGYENASREYTGEAIKQLVKAMRMKGWVFTYIGANQDVDAVAESIAINNRMSFSANDTGTRAMFQKEKMSRKRFFSKIQKGIADIESNYFD